MKYIRRFAVVPVVLLTCAVFGFAFVTPHTRFAVPSAAVQSPGGSGTGLRGEYYDNQDFTLLKVTRTDPTVNFDWGNGSPDATIGADTFSVRWSGQVEARYSETYTFYTMSDDGVRLWVNNQQLINNWTLHRSTSAPPARTRLKCGWR